MILRWVDNGGRSVRRINGKSVRTIVDFFIDAKSPT
jgi:hypothetical protein